MHLYLAYKNYSAWSLRLWLAMKTFGLEFLETILPFAHRDSLSEYSESRCVLPQVPALEDGDLMIPDSLASSNIWLNVSRPMRGGLKSRN